MCRIRLKEDLPKELQRIEDGVEWELRILKSSIESTSSSEEDSYEIGDISKNKSKESSITK